MGDGGGTIQYSATLPGTWRRHAGKLRRSAEFLWAPLAHALTLQPPFSDDDVALWDHCYAFLLVAGASLEAMIKAAAIQAHMNVDGFRRVVRPDGQMERWLTVHNLVALADRANISLADGEREPLERFEKYVVWAGSYPTSKNLVTDRPDAGLQFDFNVSDYDWTWFERLYNKAEDRYQQDLAARRARVQGGE